MKNQRRAFTLIELLTTVTVASTLMVLAVSLVHKTLLLSQAARDKSQRMQATNLFMDQFRQDIHAAKSLAMVSDKELKVEYKDELPVVYRIVQQQITRERQPLSGVMQRESLSLGDRTVGQFELLTGPLRAALTLATELDTADAQWRLHRRVEAVVGAVPQVDPSLNAVKNAVKNIEVPISEKSAYRRSISPKSMPRR